MEYMDERTEQQVASLAPGGSATWGKRFILSRDWLHHLMLWLAVLRTNEAMSAVFGSASFRTSTYRPGYIDFWVPPLVAKNHVTVGKWVHMEFAGPGRLSFQRSLRAHELLLSERGVSVQAATPLFGLMGAPSTRLKSAKIMYSDNFVQGLILPTLIELGMSPSLAAAAKWTAYTFRRGGINDIYAQMRRDGVSDPTLVLSTLRLRGRWKSDSSLLEYLVEIDEELAALLRVNMSRRGPQERSGRLRRSQQQGGAHASRTRTARA
jgi:hypothetical protein